jgi:uncharacterized protein (TIGR03435 family)
MRIWPGSAVSTSILAAAMQLYGQSDQASKSFEVASVKRLLQESESRSTGGGPGTSDPGRWWRSNVTLASLLVEAFQIQGNAIAGPDWLRSTRYEIVAKVPAGATRDDVPLMLQRLLTERFGLKYRREEKEMPAYALVIGKNGPKLRLSTASPAPIPHRDGYPDLPEGVAPGAMKIDSVGYLRRFVAGAMSMAQFADYLAAQSDLPVIDRTELSGRYEVVLYYLKPSMAGNPAVSPDENRFDLPTALREQLGLDLQKAKKRVDLLVVDHIEQTPSAN